MKTLLQGAGIALSVVILLSVALCFVWFKTYRATVVINSSVDAQSRPVAEKPSTEENVEITGTQQERTPLAVTFTGDIMLDRSVWKEIQQHGAHYPFENIESIVGKTDLLIGNLEGPVTERGSHAVPNGTLLFKFDPSTISPLKDAGFVAVSLANNHTRNQGKQGLEDTRRFLRDEGVAAFGDPWTVEDESVWRTIVNGWSLAFVGWNRIETPEDTSDALVDLVRSLDSEVDRVVVLPHWGAEYVPQRVSERALAERLIAAGADLIIGTHPHVVQGLEEIDGRLVAYSLGNFIFDQSWSVPTQQGVILKVIFDESKPLNIDVEPVQITAAQPRQASSSERKAVFGRIKASSTPSVGEALVGGDGAFDIGATD